MNKSFLIIGFVQILELFFGQVDSHPVNGSDRRIREANSLIEAMDLSVNPCEDFFQYACGGWIARNPLPPSRSRWSQIDMIREQVVIRLKAILEQEIDARDPKPLNSAREMYKACMDTRAIQASGLKPLLNVLNMYGGWPITKKSQNAYNSFDWKVVTASIRKIYRISYLVTVYNDLDHYDTQRSSIYIDQGSLAVPRSILLNANAHPKVMTAYFDYIYGAAKIIRDTIQGDALDAQLVQDVNDIIAFEVEIAKISSPAEERRNSSRMYNPMILTDMQSWTNGLSFSTEQAHINWYEYLNAIYSRLDIYIPINERIIVVEKEYLASLLALLDRTPNKVIANYVMWRLVRLLSPGTTNQMTLLTVNFSKALYGSPQTEPRSNNCANEINNLLGFAVGAKYIENNFNDETKREVESMISYLKSAFETLITEADWMDGVTKSIAREKIEAIMVELVGYPEWIKNKEKLEAYYDGLLVSKNGHFENIQNVNELLTRKDLKNLRQKSDRNRWITFPSVVNAFYAPRYNSLSFPAGILQSPYYSSRESMVAMNYGGIGVVIGHEITHGFDDRGRQNDKNGNIAPWWSENTLAQYLSRANCFVNKFHNYVVLNGTRLNGVTTLGENMADYGGIREAFAAYRSYVATNGVESPLPGLEQFTAEQIFFITFANTHCGVETPEKLLDRIMNDPHSPSRYRVIGTLSNSEDFMHVFNCPPSSPMNQLNKCALWRR